MGHTRARVLDTEGGRHWPRHRGVLTEPLSLLFSADGSFSLEALVVSEAAGWALEEPPWEGLFPVSVFTSASASC